MKAPCIISIDVEDWFHILDLPTTPKLDKWDSISPSLVEKNFLYQLDLCLEYNIKTTCFFLGWVAEKFPHLVVRAMKDGHEIASHGYAHELVYEIGAEAFYEDILKSKKILEDITGKEVKGYRAPGFSVTEDTPWFYEKLAEAGYSYSSSVFPGSRGHGGWDNGQLAPYKVPVRNTHIVEIPATLAHTFGKEICFFGGGYLRFFPFSVIRKKIKQVQKENRPVNVYIHPRETDVSHPKLPMSVSRKFKSYVNMKSTEPKLKKIFQEFPCIRMIDYIESQSEHFPTVAFEVC